MAAVVERSRGRAVEEPCRTGFRFEKLNVWQSARRLAGEVYAVTKVFPRDELFGLTGQLRRAAVSITANIAEGSGRNSDADFAHFLEIAYGSTMEVASLLFIAADAGHLSPESRGTLLALSREVTAQLNALNHSLTVSRSKTPFARRPVP
jgi:four helix bundle protein